EILTYSTGFSIEPYEIVNLIEEFGGIFPIKYPDVMNEGMEILQIETRNPHFHEDKGQEHLKEMLRDSLYCIYNSKLCSPAIKQQILKDLKTSRIISGKKQPQSLKTIQPIKDLDIAEFTRNVMERCSTFGYHGTNLSRQMETLTAAR
ncbi:MAG: mannosyl-3-phosphoglycerate synthase, partial [Nitrososphaerales archaeon]